MPVSRLTGERWAVFVAAWAIQALLSCARTKDVADWIVLLGSGDSAKRVEAAEALGAARGEAAVQPLITALRDREPRVRCAASKALGEIGHVRPVAPLTELMKTDSVCGGDAALALGRLGASGARALVGALGDESTKEVAKAALRTAGSTAVDALIEALRSEDSAVSQRAVALLGELRDPRAVDALVLAVQREESDPWVRHFAVDALGAIGKPAVDGLIRILEDRSNPFSTYAARILGQMADDRAAEPLLARLKEDVERGRLEHNVVEALGRLRVRRAVPLLVELGTRHLPNITPFADNYAVAQALKDISVRDRNTVKPLIDALQSKNPWQRKAASISLAAVEVPEVSELLLARFESGDLASVSGGHSFFIQRGRAGTETSMLRALHEYGDPEMAHTYASCGSPALEKAGHAWLTSHGWTIPVIGYQGPPRPTWGRR